MEDLGYLRSHLDQYANKYRHINFSRDDHGVLEMTLHTDHGPLRWGRVPHAELEDAFLNIGRDRQNKVVIMTGTGDEFSGPTAEPEHNRKYHRLSADLWGELGWESKGLLNNLLSIDVPMISAINGPAVRHPELPLMCDIVLASDTAVIQDSAHFVGGLVPGDGVHVVFTMLMGLNRARYFLLTGQRIGAVQAENVGLVNEVMSVGDLLPRARDLARQIASKPTLHRRFARILIIEQLRRQISELLPYGLALESLASLSEENWAGERPAESTSTR